jgi:hypothetical protein
MARLIAIGGDSRVYFSSETCEVAISSNRERRHALNLSLGCSV